MVKVALITGITGQDGSYLAELLLEKGYEVHGIVRRSSSINTDRIDHIFDKIKLHYGDMQDAASIIGLVSSIKPDEIYNLAAQSHVKVSFEIPSYSVNSSVNGCLNLLEAIRIVNPKIRFYQASSSEMFGSALPPQSETTRFQPRSPYACAKVYCYYQTINYRESYGIFACNGILFNHESPRRGETFVTQKVVKGLVKCFKGEADCVELGNIKAKRDWGHAKDYVRAMWMMLQHDTPDDYVVATGKQYSVEELIAFTQGYLAVAFDKPMMEDYVKINPKYFRPAEVDSLLGDPSKIKRVLGWEPEYTFYNLIAEMIGEELKK